MYTYMAHLINVSDPVYFELKRMKGKNSFSQLIIGLIGKKRKEGKAEMIAFIKQLEKEAKGKKKENISEHVDEIAYGVGKTT